jgi:hypothetical protein
VTDTFPLAAMPALVGQLFGRPVEFDPDLLIGADYRPASDAEIQAVRTRLADILGDANVGASALDKWEQGWAEVRARVTRDGVSEATLAPQYFRHRTLRLLGRYIQARSASFEPKLYTAIKSVIFGDYLGDAKRIVEFGCGTGTNLFQIHNLLPQAHLVGCDWARPSQEIIGLIADATGADLTGVHFDMRTLEGRESVPLDASTTILTLHAMEQLGRDFSPFLDYIVASKPKLVVHLEPIVELYSAANEFDAAAVAYHRKRGYLEGFLPALQNRSDVEIVETRRLGFGSTFHEAYTLIVWRPRR